MTRSPKETFPLAARVLAAALITASCSGGGGGAGNSSVYPPGPTGPTTPTTASVVVSGASSVDFGHSIQLTAQARDASGATITGKTFTWSSDNSTIATVAQDGTVTGAGIGSANISATVDGKSGSLALGVTSPVANVVISGSLTPQAGSTTQLSASPKDASGATVPNAPVTWSTSDNTMMTVDATGLVNALRIGSVTITATSLGKSATATVTSSLTPFTFVFNGASATDQQVIKDAVQQAQKFFQATFGRNIQNATTVTGTTTSGNAQCAANQGNTAFTGPGAVVFCVNNPGWAQMGPIMRTKIGIHETFHVLQFEVRWIGSNGLPPSPSWMIEGSAELVGFSGIADKGLLTLAVGRQCNIKEWADFNTRNPSTPMPPLSQLETQQQWTTVFGPSYDPAFLGMDQLTATGGLVTLKTFWTAYVGGAAWAAAFQSAFGTSSTAFYAQFPGYAAALPVPPTYPCGGI